jgi:hypothetical protein
VHISSTCKVGQKLGVGSPSVSMISFGVTIPATVPQGSKIPYGLTNNPVYYLLQLLKEFETQISNRCSVFPKNISSFIAHKHICQLLLSSL